MVRIRSKLKEADLLTPWPSTGLALILDLLGVMSLLYHFCPVVAHDFRTYLLLLEKATRSMLPTKLYHGTPYCMADCRTKANGCHLARMLGSAIFTAVQASRIGIQYK